MHEPPPLREIAIAKAKEMMTSDHDAPAEQAMASVLFGLFGLAVDCALCAIIAFTVEMLLAGTGIREEVAQSRRSAAQVGKPEGAGPRRR